MTEPIKFAIVGAGWRSDFYLRVAKALPERFAVTGVLMRNAEKADAVREAWGVPAFVGTLDDLLRDKPSFVVTSVPWPVNPGLLSELAERKIPALSETPPAPDVAQMLALWDKVGATARIQIAEQYPFQPLHAARIALAASGKLGTISHAYVSAAHGYHGVALIRRLLGVGLEPVAINAQKLVSDIIAGPGRNGPPAEEQTVRSEQVIATLRFEGGQSAVFDFTGDQYFSWIRSARILVRGDRGEINNVDVRYLQDFGTPIQTTLVRRDAGQIGNLEGYHHIGYMAGDSWVYRNPVAPGRLSDDEIAIADSLLRMGEYAAGGPGFYNLADGFHDHALGIAIDQAAASGSEVRTDRLPWDR
ncbi:MAG TPA: Gfo/Idh/MocA family oxidoreductase [Capsulimonadaceae bacterium]|jgi:predicted dehydrogenase